MDIFLDICLVLSKDFCLLQPEKPWLVPTRVSRTGVRPGVPEAGTPTIRGRGRSGLSLLDLGVSRGGTPKVPEKAGRVGLDITRPRPKNSCYLFIQV